MSIFWSKLSRAQSASDQSSSEHAAEADFNAQLRKATDIVSNPIMIAGRDFKVTYINEAAKALMIKHREAFQALARNFDPHNMIGACIDMFHKDPSHQRRMLSDPSRLPHRTDIKVGPLTFSLCVSASYDSNGTYAGNILEWNDVTELRELSSNAKGQIEAINKALAVIEFTLGGDTITANENFQKALGYSLNEIKGKPHSIFVDAAYRQSPEYRLFWDKLARGEYQSGEYKRIAKGGREVWI